MTRVSHTSRFPVNAERLFNFHMDAANLARISPPFPSFAFEGDVPGRTFAGQEQRFVLSIGPLRRTWVAKVTAVQSTPGPRSGALFIEDRQDEGPFRAWRHQHQVFADGGDATLRDVIEFSFFPGGAGALLDRAFVWPGLKAMLAYRHWRTRRLLERS
jgi:ligand-binding SRPBCC domain-containing protein